MTDRSTGFGAWLLTVGAWLTADVFVRVYHKQLSLESVAVSLGVGYFGCLVALPVGSLLAFWTLAAVSYLLDWNPPDRLFEVAIGAGMILFLVFAYWSFDAI